MKRFSMILASAAMLFAGCARELATVSGEGGDIVTTTVSVFTAAASKADTDPTQAGVERCIIKVLVEQKDGNFVLYDTAELTSGTPALQFSTQFDLIKDQTYQFFVWADHGAGYYTLSDDGNVVRNNANADNDDNLDAFTGMSEQIEIGNSASTVTITAVRPFAQLNLITTDIKENFQPSTISVSYTAPVGMNIYTGELGAAQTITTSAAPYYATWSAVENKISVDYIFATAGSQSILSTIGLKAKYTNLPDAERSYSSIPVQANYRTNVKGKLLTTGEGVTVDIKPAWETPDNDVEIAVAGTVAAANEAFANGATNVEILSVGTETTLYLPQTTEEVSVKFDNPTETITVNYGPDPTKAAGERPAAVNIATNDITKFTVSGISNVVWLAGNQAALANALTNATNKQTVALSDDITMSGEWTPITLKDGAIFDGKGRVISNMTITDCGLDYAALICYMASASEVKNVTVKNATIVYNSGKSARGAAIVGIAYGGTIENCHAENVSIKGYQKMGGIVGYLAQSGKQIIVRNCSAKNISFTNNTVDLTYQAGGIIGYTLNYDGDILVEGCSVSDITINNQYDGSEGENSAYYCGTFIGSLDNQAVKEGLKIELKNNTISGTNTPQIDQMYANTYFGWANNPEATSKDKKAYLATILIDGQEWTPDYPFKNVTTGKGYATLDAALAALKADETLEIWQKGEYTVETLKSPANSTIDAKVPGVVFNHTAAASSWIASDGISGRTVKNITWKIGNANYQALHVDNLIGCTINGRFYPHRPATFTECVFNAPGYEYCLWTWNSDATFKSCIFNTQGKAVNVYGSSTNTYTFEDCVFNATNIPNDKGKAAIFVKDGVDKDNQNAKVNVIIKNCTANYERPYNQLDPGDVQYSESVLWNVEIGKEPFYGTNEITISVGGEKVYPFTKFSVSDATGLRNAIKMFNKGKEQVEYSIELADGTYEVSDMPIIQAAKKSLVVKAKNEGKAILTPDAGTKTNHVFLISGGGLTNKGDEWVTFEGLKFNMPNDPGKITSAVFCTAQNDATYSPLVGESMTRYAHNITVRNCELQGCGSENSSLLKAAQGAGANIALVDNCVVNHSGYVVSDYFSNVRIVNTKVTDTKACANIANVGITVEGCDISTYHDYCIRTNGGPLVVKDNTFNITYSGSDSAAGVVVLRGTSTEKSPVCLEATISGNTFTKASQSMWDCYCKTAWTVNGEAKAAGTGINF